MNFKRKAKTVAVALGMGAMLAGCKTNDVPKETKAIVTEMPEEENIVDELAKVGIVLTQEFGTEYYRIDKSSAGPNGSINDYFEEKCYIPTYDVKCNPIGLSELMYNSSDLNITQLSDMPVFSAIAYNHKIGSTHREKVQAIINDIYFPGRGVYYDCIIKYNLLNLTVKDVMSDEEYLSKFEPVECCIYINKKYANTPELEKIAYELALEDASICIYINIDGVRAYCSLTNFYYDVENNKIIEVGKTYSRSCLLFRKHETYSANDFNRLFPKQYEDISSFMIGFDLVTSGMNELNDEDFTKLHNQKTTDFSERLNIVVRNSKNPEEAKNITRMLVNIDLGNILYLMKSVEYCNKYADMSPKIFIECAVPETVFSSNVKSLQDNLIKFSTTLKNAEEQVEDTHSPMGMH